MTDYEDAFTRGELQAHLDRFSAKPAERPERPMTTSEAAWWDGYLPRTTEWKRAAPLWQREAV